MNEKNMTKNKQTLSIVVPVYNETQRLALTFQAFSQPVDWGVFDLQEIIFVNDGSTDKTLAMLRQHRAELERHTGAKVHILSYSQNRGKGYASRRGMLFSQGDYSLLMDADMSTPLSEVDRLQSGVKKGRALIIGTRKSKIVRVEKEQSWLRVKLGRVFTWLSQMILNTCVTDFTCGFKLFRADVREQVFRRSRIDRWGYDSEILFLAVRLGYKPYEVAVRWLNDERSRVNILQDSLRSFQELLQIRYYQWTGVYQLPKLNKLYGRCYYLPHVNLTPAPRLPTSSNFASKTV